APPLGPVLDDDHQAPGLFARAAVSLEPRSGPGPPLVKAGAVCLVIARGDEGLGRHRRPCQLGDLGPHSGLALPGALDSGEKGSGGGGPTLGVGSGGWRPGRWSGGVPRPGRWSGSVPRPGGWIVGEATVERY